VLFPPRDNAAHALQLLVESATTAIKVEMFTYCDKAVDAILHEKATLPGLELQMTFDVGQAAQDKAMAKLLAGWQTELGKRVVTGRSERGQIIHRKIVVVDHLYVGSGSTNWTVDGEQLEDNELVIRRSRPLAAWYEQTLDANHTRLVDLAQGAASA
jgi:phosphatidylserine/phosphatidylglycerophosphate/cardiolipin synthase-like enzyme